jgi:tetratricopeptide (TPR) repeat protein
VDERDRPRVLYRLGAALHLAGNERRIEILEQARDLLVAAGDPETAAEASLLLAEAWWFRGQRDPARKHLARAQELVSGRDASPAAARVFAQVARHSMLAGEDEQAIESARQALALADELGLEEVRVLALNVLGTARVYTGDRCGFADLERALELALAANSPEAARVYNNLGAVLYGQGEIRRCGELWREGKEVAERLGNATVGRYLSGHVIGVNYDNGDWEEALRAANAFIAECEAGSPHYLEGGAHGLRGGILFARDEVDGALAAVARAVELGREAKDPQALTPALGIQLRVAADLGRTAEARLVAHELLSLDGNAVGLALTADALELHDEVGALIASKPDTPWTRAAGSILAGELEQAADLLEEIGDRPGEAEVRLRAAAALVAAGRRAEADAQLAKALAFYRSVGATRFIREGEALLAKTA